MIMMQLITCTVYHPLGTVPTFLPVTSQLIQSEQMAPGCLFFLHMRKQT